MNVTRGVAYVLAAADIGYEVYTLREQKRSLETEKPVNNTWSQITRDIPGLGTLVGMAVFEIAIDGAAAWFKRHIKEGMSSS